jgi:hypothetical protein
MLDVPVARRLGSRHGGNRVPKHTNRYRVGITGAFGTRGSAIESTAAHETLIRRKGVKYINAHRHRLDQKPDEHVAHFNIDVAYARNKRIFSVGPCRGFRSLNKYR